MRLLLACALLGGIGPGPIHDVLDSRQASHELRQPASATRSAVRIDPPRPVETAVTTTVPVPPDPCAVQRLYRIAAGLPARFDAIVWRESRCQADPSVRTWCCVGPTQLWVALHLRDHRLAPLYAACGIDSEYDVDGGSPVELERHWCAVAALFGVVGWAAWST